MTKNFPAKVLPQSQSSPNDTIDPKRKPCHPPSNKHLESKTCQPPSNEPLVRVKPSTPLSNNPPVPPVKRKRCNAGFVNKGNTCYANAMLQALSVVPTLWAQWSSEINTIVTISKSNYSQYVHTKTLIFTH